MSKYIIEIEEKPLCVFDKDTQTYFPRLWRVKGFNSLVFDEEGLSRLEELTSDYINEHFGSLQDDAYHRGLAEGKKAFDLLDAERDAEYQRGLEDGKAVNDKGCVGCKFEGNGKDHSPCDYCCNGYSNQYQAKQTDDEIEVGDEVIYNNTMKCLVVRPETDERYAVLIDSNGSHHSADHRECKKTGRHFDISSILKEMQS